jgi:hypothetical protein
LINNNLDINIPTALEVPVDEASTPSQAQWNMELNDQELLQSANIIEKDLFKFYLSNGEDRSVTVIFFRDTDYLLFEQWGKNSYKRVKVYLKQWLEVCDCTERAYKELEKLCKGEKDVSYRQHIGSNMYVDIHAPYRCVHIRRFLPNNKGELKATEEGVSLRLREFDELCNKMQEIADLTELNKVVRCLDQSDHANRMGFLACSNCNPNTYKFYL